GSVQIAQRDQRAVLVRARLDLGAKRALSGEVGWLAAAGDGREPADSHIAERIEKRIVAPGPECRVEPLVRAREPPAPRTIVPIRAGGVRQDRPSERGGEYQSPSADALEKIDAGMDG